MCTLEGGDSSIPRSKAVLRSAREIMDEVQLSKKEISDNNQAAHKVLRSTPKAGKNTFGPSNQVR